MFQLPFHIDRPLAIGLFLFLFVGVFVYLLIIFKNEHGKFRKAMEFLLGKWPIELSIEKKLSLFRGCLVFMIFLHGAMSAFSLSVALGVIKNGERHSITIEDIMEFERRMEEQDLQRRSGPELEGLKERYGVESENQPSPSTNNR